MSTLPEFVVTIAKGAFSIVGSIGGISYLVNWYRERPKVMVHSVDEQRAYPGRWDVVFVVENIGGGVTSLRPHFDALVVDLAGRLQQIEMEWLAPPGDLKLEPHEARELTATQVGGRQGGQLVLQSRTIGCTRSSSSGEAPSRAE